MRELIRAIRVSLILWVITAIIYPSVMLIIGLVLPYQANGSLLVNASRQPIGSALIGQSFTSDKYFWSRPSAINYSSAASNNDPNNILKTGISGASNLAPSNSQELLKDNRKPEATDLIKRIRSEADRLQKAGIKPTADLVYTSASGLDPHISIEAALAQVDRVAKARSAPTDMIQAQISKDTDGRFLSIFGEPGVNVLRLNQFLDRQFPSSTTNQ